MVIETTAYFSLRCPPVGTCPSFCINKSAMLDIFGRLDGKSDLRSNTWTKNNLNRHPESADLGSKTRSLHTMRRYMALKRLNVHFDSGSLTCLWCTQCTICSCMARVFEFFSANLSGPAAVARASP